MRKALKRQSFKDYDWLIGSRFDPKIAEATWVPDNFTGGFWSLNRTYNKLFKQATGELIVSLQDNIWINSNGLQTFWDSHRAYPDIVISGVGDQYAELDEYGKPQIKVWSDPRRKEKYGTFYELNHFSDIEWNWCAIPRNVLVDVGGFCEQLDFSGFGMDGYQVNERLSELGYKFFMDQSNESFSLFHDRMDYGGKKSWEENNNISNGMYQKIKQEFKDKNEWPRMQFLK